MDSLGDRIKRYEESYQYKLTPRSCLFVRVDGKAFHTLTKKMEKPFDKVFINAMNVAATRTAQHMQGFKLAYVQSDECTFMMTDFDTLQTQGWFGYELNKIVSISAAYFTAYFNDFMNKNVVGWNDIAVFDSRAFIVPKDDAPNVFIWRQKDWERNSLQMFARSQFSHKELENKSQKDMHEMLHSKELNWAKLADILKNGTWILHDYTKAHYELSYEDIHDLLFAGIED